MARPSSHRIGDRGQREFFHVIPTTWTAQKPDPDYGHDVRIEVFEASDESTGLVFYAQVRTTDSERSPPKITLERDERDYYSSHALPTMIVRVTGENHVYWKWDFTIPPVDSENQSQTFHFSESDLWDASSPSLVEEDLRTLRWIQSQITQFKVELDVSGVSIRDRMRVLDAAQRTIDSLPNSSYSTRDERILIHLSDTGACAKVGTFYCFKIEFDKGSLSDVRPLMLYLLATVLGHIGANRAANTVADHCLGSSLPSKNTEMAFNACLALLEKPEKAVKLAIINTLHLPENPFGANFTGALRQATSGSSSDEVFVEWLSIVLHEAERAGLDEAVATAHYNLGNAFRSQGEHLKAVRHLRAAIAQSNTYTEVFAHAWSELGGVLFLTRHFSASARCYAKALEIEQSPHLHYCLGDALFFSGCFELASEHLSRAASFEDQNLSVQAYVKAQLAAQLSQTHGAEFRRRPSEASDVSSWQKILSDIDPLCDWANFNAGIVANSLGEHERALGHFLIAAISCGFIDEEAWENVLISAMKMNETGFLALLMTYALSVGGLTAVDRFRSRLLDHGGDPEMIENLDRAASEIAAGRSKMPPLTIRLIDSETGRKIVL